MFFTVLRIDLQYFNIFITVSSIRYGTPQVFKKLKYPIFKLYLFSFIYIFDGEYWLPVLALKTIIIIFVNDIFLWNS
jgi:hypothetical protein